MTLTRPFVVWAVFPSLFLASLLSSAALADEESTWSVIQHGILAGNCAGCHQAGTAFAQQSGLELTPDVAYDELVNELPKNTSARVDGLRRVSTLGGQVGLHQSFLWEKINASEQEHLYSDHPGYGALMPLGLPPLTNGELAYVREWILAGAPQTGVVAPLSLLDDTSRYEPPPFEPLPTLAPNEGISLHLGPYNIWSSELYDREFFYYKPYPTAEDRYVARYEIAYDGPGHHFILYNYPQGASTPTPNTYRDLRDQSGNINPAVALQLGQLFPFRMFVGSQTPHVNYSFPPGVALRLPAGQGFDLNVHSVNRSGTATTGEVYVNLHTVPLSEVEHVADFDYCGPTSLNIPPNSTVTLTYTCAAFQQTRHIIQMWSHSHEHTLEFKIWGVGGVHDGQLLYQSNDWEHPPLYQFDPPLTFQAGDRVRLETTYQNTTNNSIGFGFLSSDEMQFLFYAYYTGALTPSPPIPGDINQDGEVNRLDVALFAQHYGRNTASIWATGDFNDDGRTDLFDLGILKSYFGQRQASSPLGAHVPEPGAMGSAGLCLALAAAAARRRRKAR